MSTEYRYKVNYRANHGRILTYEAQSPVYAATLSITTDKAETLVKVGQLTGAITINTGVGTSATPPFIGDKLTFLFGSDGTDRVVTFGTGMKSTGTLTVTANKFASAVFMFDGTNWIQISTAVTA